jgi:hypothetical protein
MVLQAKNGRFPAYSDASHSVSAILMALPKGCHLDVVGGPSTTHDPESDAGGSLSSWQGHPSR